MGLRHILKIPFATTPPHRFGSTMNHRRMRHVSHQNGVGKGCKASSRCVFLLHRALLIIFVVPVTDRKAPRVSGDPAQGASRAPYFLPPRHAWKCDHMCGIAGFLDARRSTTADEAAARARAMADAVKHRGPDDSDVWTDPAAGIG